WCVRAMQPPSAGRWHRSSADSGCEGRRRRQCSDPTTSLSPLPYRRRGFVFGSISLLLRKRFSMLMETPRPLAADWLVGGGEMGERIRAHDWARTALGPIESWPQSLRSALSICLGSRFPIVLYWGAELTVLYNDAYAEILGRKHPWALG